MYKYKPPVRRYTQKEISFIKENVAGRSYLDLTVLFNNKFLPPVTIGQIRNFMKNNKLRNGNDTRFRSGYTPPSPFVKGHKFGIATKFKPGHRPRNYLPVGSERINSEGYINVKVSDSAMPVQRRWKAKHIIVWEALNGKVPKNHVIFFADGNKLNLAAGNLLLISRRELCVMNHLGLVYSHRDLTVAGKAIADIKLLINDRKRETKKGARR